MEEKDSKNNSQIELSSDNSTSNTPIDDSIIEENEEKKRDLSAIIPKFAEEDNNANAIELISKDNELKSDGAVSLGTINSELVTTVNNEAKLPEQIDIEQRKIDAQKRKNQHNKKNH